MFDSGRMFFFSCSMTAWRAGIFFLVLFSSMMAILLRTSSLMKIFWWYGMDFLLIYFLKLPQTVLMHSMNCSAFFRMTSALLYFLQLLIIKSKS